MMSLTDDRDKTTLNGALLIFCQSKKIEVGTIFKRKAIQVAGPVVLVIAGLEDNAAAAVNDPKHVAGIAIQVFDDPGVVYPIAVRCQNIGRDNKEARSEDEDRFEGLQQSIGKDPSTCKHAFNQGHLPYAPFIDLIGSRIRTPA